MASKLVLWTSRLLAAIFIMAGANKISYPFKVNPSFLEGAIKVVSSQKNAFVELTLSVFVSGLPGC